MLLHCSDEPERWRIDAHGGVLYDLQAQRTAAYDRVAVPADGNCFYSALCAAACLSLPALALRRCIADTLEVHGDTIFPTVQQFADPIMTRTSYNDDVQLVRTAGRWNCALGDSLPLIVARHVLKCTILSASIALLLLSPPPRQRPSQRPPLPTCCWASKIRNHSISRHKNSASS